MTDPHESKARELLTGTVTSEPAFGELSRRIAAALRTARNEAIEEAAKLVDDATPPPDHGVLYIVRENMGLLAKAIRSLATHPAGGHDG